MDQDLALHERSLHSGQPIGVSFAQACLNHPLHPELHGGVFGIKKTVC